MKRKLMYIIPLLLFILLFVFMVYKTKGNQMKNNMVMLYEYSNKISEEPEMIETITDSDIVESLSRVSELDVNYDGETIGEDYKEYRMIVVLDDVDSEYTVWYNPEIQKGYSLENGEVSKNKKLLPQSIIKELFKVDSDTQVRKFSEQN